LNPENAVSVSEKASDNNNLRRIMKDRRVDTKDRSPDRKVLVVDDEPDVLEMFSQFLNLLGYEVGCSGSGEDAIERYKILKPDAVLIDRHMPGIDGFECARKVLEIDPGARIVMTSGGIEPGSWSETELNRQIRGCLSKPFRMAELGRVLARVFEDLR
jgi:CheY-like chemotaxis protein